MADTLAEAFVNSGLIVRENILDALGVQRSRGGALDTALLEAELATERDILEVLEQHYNLESANRNQVERIDMGIIEAFPRHYAETYRMAPLRVSGNSIRLLVSTPPHPRVLERIEKRIKLQPIAVIAVEARLHDAMRRLYGKEPPPRFATLLDSLAQRPDTPPKTTLDITQNIEVDSAPREPEQAAEPEVLVLETFREASTAATTPAVLMEQVLGACSQLFETVVYLKNDGSGLSGQGGRRGDEEIAYPLIVDDWADLQDVLETSEVVALSLVHTHTEHVLNLPASTPALGIAIRAHLRTQGVLVGFRPQSAGIGDALKSIGEIANAKLDILLPVPSPLEEAEEETTEAVEEETPEAEEQETPEAVEQETPEAVEEETPEAVEEETPEAVEEETPEAEEQETPEAEEEETPEAVEEETPEAEEEETPEAEEEETPEVEEETTEAEEEETAEAVEEQEPEKAPVSLEMEPWNEVVQATQALGLEEEQEPAATSPAEQNETPLVQSSEEEVTASEPVDLSQTAPSNIQEPTLVMAPPMVEQLIQESTPPQAEATEPPQAQPQEVDRDALITALESDIATEREQAIEQLLALEEQVDVLIRNRFPGPIGFDPFANGTVTPSLKDCNGLMAYLDRRGANGIDIVSSHLQSSNPRARFFALYMMHHHASAEHLDLISRRLYDTQPAIRIMAAETLRRHKASAQYTLVLQGLMRQLKVPVLETRVSVVQIFGQLRERRAVPVLISLLGHGGRELVSTAVSALAVICGQEFGIDTEAWQAWWSENQNNDRGSWLCQGLLHKNPAIQNVCNRELELSSGLSMGYQNQMSHSDKKKVAARWSSWLNEQEEVDFSI